MDGPPYRCPVCREEYDQPFVVCVNCGMNTQSGQIVRPSVGPDPEEEQDQPPPSKGRVAAAWLMEYFPGLFRPVLLVFAIVLGIVGLGILVMGLVMVMGFFLIFAGGVTIIVGSMAWAQAVAMILDGEFSFLVDQLTEFDETQWALWFTGLLLPGTVMVIAAVIATSGQ